MKRRHLRIHHEQGFSLIELLVAMFVLLVGVAGTIAMLDRANARTVENRGREAGTALAREVVERSRSVPYTSITSAGLPGRLQAMEGLADSDAGRGGWQVDRRGVRYTISVGACSVDDGKDGFGRSDPSSWCSGSSTGTQDPNPDDYKRVTVEVTWSQPGAKGTVRQQTLVNSPGSAAGPAVTSLTVTSGSNPCLATCSGPLGFTATTSTPPATVAWLVDGAHTGTATGSGTTWSFTWSIANLTDGDYLVGVRAYDSQGRSRASRTLTVRLNRSAPSKPRGFAAGRNNSIVDVEWISNPERDVIGYRVYRQVEGQAPQQVMGTCASHGDRTRQNSCYDSAPPAGAVTYWVRAVDLDPANQSRESVDSDRVTVTGTSTPPSAVRSLRLVAASELTWSAPAGNPPAAFYRIYRDGTAYANRYDRTADDKTGWIDPRPTGNHTYWVTAVTSQLAESTAVEAKP